MLARPARAEKLRDLADVEGARENQLIGYGIVTGLTQTGDDISVPFTAQSLLSLLRRLGLQVETQQLRLRNVAAVIVTATLPPYAKPGSKIDINVSSIGNAKSLMGGTLLLTVLHGADQKTYAVAQGNMVLGGFEAHGQTGSSVKSGTLTAGRIPEGATVEREVLVSPVNNGAIKLNLRTPGASVASHIAQAVNAKFPNSASPLDGGAVSVKVPGPFEAHVVDLIAQLEDIEVTTVRRARVVINERTGTIVAGGDVRLAPVAVVHGGLTIVVKETPQVSQPNTPFTNGKTVVTKQSDVQANEQPKPVAFVPAAATLADVASTLGKLGLSPRELTSVLQALRGAGALEAELVVQ